MVRSTEGSGPAVAGIVAAGHPLTARAGVDALRAGGNAVDAALAAMLTSFVAEPLLTGLGAGGYMIVSEGAEQVLLDFFVEAPERPAGAGLAELEAIDVSFGDAEQVFYVGPASCGVYGVPAGVCAAAQRWGSMPLTDLAAPAARLARAGVSLNAQQAYVAEILGELLRSTPECAALWAPRGRILREGEVLVNPELGDSIELLARAGAEPFYAGEIAAALSATLATLGGSITMRELAGYRAIERPPLRVAYRDREVLTNPPPSAGGTLLAYALTLLDRRPTPPTLKELIAAMEAAQAERTPEFMAGLAADGFLERYLASRLGATTHISVMDTTGMACGVTTTNGEGSGVVIPGTGIHLNNVMGEQDLSPLGFHRHLPGTRMPSMMAPTLLMRGGQVEVVLGSAGSNRIRSALLQTIVGIVDRGLTVQEALRAPRAHCEDGVIYHEPGIDLGGLPLHGREVVGFHGLNLFFGGVQAVHRTAAGLIGAGDPRRGGVALSA